MAVTITITMDDLLGISGQAQGNLNRLLQWAGEVNDTIGSVSKELRVVASTAACKAIAAVDRADGDVLILADSGQVMRFSAASSAPEALGPPITVIAPSAGTGRWLAVALPPQASVGSTALAPLGVTPAKIANAAQSAGGGAFTVFPTFGSYLSIGNTFGNTDLSASGYSVSLLGAWYIPEATVGALSTIQIQTAGGAVNITEALNIASAAAGSVNQFATIDLEHNTLAANEGFRVETVGTDLAGALICLWAKLA